MKKLITIMMLTASLMGDEVQTPVQTSVSAGDVAGMAVVAIATPVAVVGFIVSAIVISPVILVKAIIE